MAESLYHLGKLEKFVLGYNWICYRTKYFDTGSRSLIEAEKIMREFLLVKWSNLGHIENHIFFFGPIKEVTGEINDFDLHTAIAGSVVGYTYISHDFDSSYVFLNLKGILIVTILKKSREDV